MTQDQCCNLIRRNRAPKQVTLVSVAVYGRVGLVLKQWLQR